MKIFKVRVEYETVIRAENETDARARAKSD